MVRANHKHNQSYKPNQHNRIYTCFGTIYSLIHFYHYDDYCYCYKLCVILCMCNGVGPMYFQCAWTARTSHTAFTFPKKEFVSDYYFLDVDVVAQRSLNACEYLCGWSLYYERISSRDAISHRQYTVCSATVCVYICLSIVYVSHILLAKMNFMIINATFQQYLVLS